MGIGEFAGSIILPASSYMANASDLQDRFYVKTEDGCLLETHCAQGNGDEGERKQLIIFGGNGTSLRRYYQDEVAEYTKMNFDVTRFSYRGVENSTGRAKSKNDLIRDGIAQVQHLLNQGKNPEDIIIRGHSLGGGVAVEVAAFFHDRDVRIKIYNDRSFSTLEGVVAGDPAKEGGVLGVFSQGFLKPLLGNILKLIGWHFNTPATMKRIDKDCIEHALVRGRKEDDDEVITGPGSLHYALKHLRRADNRKLKRVINLSDADLTHLKICMNEAMSDSSDNIVDIIGRAIDNYNGQSGVEELNSKEPRRVVAAVEYMVLRYQNKLRKMKAAEHMSAPDVENQAGTNGYQVLNMFARGELSSDTLRKKVSDISSQLGCEDDIECISKSLRNK